MGPNRPSLSRLASSRPADSACSHLCQHYVPACNSPADNRCCHPCHRPDFRFSALTRIGPRAGSGQHFLSISSGRVGPALHRAFVCDCVFFFVTTQNNDLTSSYKRRILILENRSTTVRTVVFPWETGSPVTKSSDMSAHGLEGMGSG